MIHRTDSARRSFRSYALAFGALFAVALLALPALAASLAVNGGAALEGSFGLEITFDGDAQRAYVEDDSPTAETHYNAKFRFDPNSIVMGENKRFKILSTRADTGERLMQALVRWRAADGEAQRRLEVRLLLPQSHPAVHCSKVLA